MSSSKKKKKKRSMRKKRMNARNTERSKRRKTRKSKSNPNPGHNPNDNNKSKRSIKVRRRRRGRAYPRFLDHRRRLSYLITRRCLGRVFRLPPNDPTRKLFEYFLAYAAKRYKIAINAVVIMSNHYHLVVSATRWNSDISGFMHCLNLNTSLVLNSRQRKRGPLYEVEPFDIQPLATKDDILRAMTYVVYNPVKAGLTEEPAEWPGLVTTFEDYGKERETVERPEFFGKSSKKPIHIKLEIVRPVPFRQLTDEEWNNLLKEYGDRYRNEIHQQRAEAGLGYLGVEALQNQSIDDTPNSPDIDRFQLAEEERATSHSSFRPNSEEEEAYSRAQDDFREDYAECMKRVKAGERPTFPYPTIKMVQTYGFPMEPSTFDAETPELHHFPELALE